MSDRLERIERASKLTTEEEAERSARAWEDRERDLETVRFQEPDVAVREVGTVKADGVEVVLVNGWLQTVDVAYVDGSRKCWGFECVSRASVRQWGPPEEAT